MNRLYPIIVYLLLVCSPIAISYAKDLGTIGDVYPIMEPNFLTTIHTRLTDFKKSGGLAKQEKIIQARVRHDILNPPVLPLVPSEHTTQVNFTPSYTLTQPVMVGGRVLYPAGMTVYPLRRVKLHEVLLFFNGTDPEQVVWAKQAAKRYPFVKRILTGGNIATLSKALGRIYYDQYAKITKSLHITHVPAIVQQVDQHLVVTFVGKETLPVVHPLVKGGQQ